jgi:hypothetical protein
LWRKIVFWIGDRGDDSLRVGKGGKLGLNHFAFLELVGAALLNRLLLWHHHLVRIVAGKSNSGHVISCCLVLTGLLIA